MRKAALPLHALRCGSLCKHRTAAVLRCRTYSKRQTGKGTSLAGLDSRSVLTDAVRLHQAGQLEQAATLYRKVLATHPDSADALHLLGMVALQQGQAKSAVELIAKAIALHGREASYHFHLALALQSLNDMQGAEAGYRRALALKPDDPDIYNNMGNY